MISIANRNKQKWIQNWSIDNGYLFTIWQYEYMKKIKMDSNFKMCVRVENMFIFARVGKLDAN